MKNKWLHYLLGVSKPHERLFFDNEFQTLSGKGNKVLVSLTIILSVTLIALSYSAGGRENLAYRMDNPFTNWLEAPLKNSSGLSKESISKVLKRFNEPKSKANYLLNEVSGTATLEVDVYKERFKPFKYKTDTLTTPIRGVIVDSEKQLFKVIIEDRNVVWKKNNDSFNESFEKGGVIIKAEILDNLGYDYHNEEFGFVPINLEGEIIFCPLIAVVKELPKSANYICSSIFHNVVLKRTKDGVYCKNFIVSNQSTGNSFQVFSSASTSTQKISEILMKVYPNDKTIDVVPLNQEDYKEFNVGAKNYKGYRLVFSPSSAPNFDQFLSLIKDCQRNGIDLSGFGLFDTSLEDCVELEDKDCYYVAFNFEELDSIRSFSKTMKEINIDLDMSDIESKENFSIVSNLTKIISLVLLAFGILSIILYVNNQLKTHLARVSSNLGTFKAFGLSNQFLETLYIKIVIAFLLIATVVSYLFIILIDSIEELLVGSINSKFNAYSLLVFASVITLVVVSLFITRNNSRKILQESPGDLIYKRTKT